MITATSNHTVTAPSLGTITKAKSVTPDRPNQVSIQSINVCGLKRKLIDIPEFKTTLNKYDISLLSETKIDDADIELIEESLHSLKLKAFFKNRKTLSAWKSGGLCIVYNESIEKHLKYVESKCNLIQWLKIDKSFMGTDKDVMIGNTYIPPIGTKYESANPYLELQDEVLKFKENYICIAGDLNSHSGTDRDYVVIDDFTSEQINYDSEAQRILNDIAWLSNKGINPSRSNTDHRNPDIYGRHLLEFCKSNGLFICNGRLKNDLIGKATTTQGSVIDYMLCSPVIMCKTKNFYIHDFDAIFSDKHCRLSWSLMSSTSTQTISNNKISNPIVIKKTHRNMWTSDKAIPFAEQLDINEVNNIHRNLINNDIDVTCILNKIENLFKDTANTVIGSEYEHQIDPNAKQKPIKFNRETLNIRNKYYKALNQNDGSEEKKSIVKITSKNYKNAVEKAQAIHRSHIIKKLSESKTKYPKYYWSVINQLDSANRNKQNDAISLDDLFNGFKTLSGNNSHGEFNSSVEPDEDDNDVNILQRELVDQILNSKITVEEIELRVNDLKNGKACGMDNILNEFIKSTFEKMKLVYVALFNKVLDTGHIPEAWTIGMIMPIYKNKGDKGDFDNYRGITILSCLGKLFTSIINFRLNKYANEVNLINENQTGFRKSYSTLDHIFLLNNIIDILVKKCDQKLYCAFVDYKKAFDTVWRSALWHKMLKSGISGKLHNLIVNMYKNIKSCVSLNGNVSDYFISENGVRQGENLSPFLFALFINDLENFLLQYGCNPIKIPGADLQIFLKLLITLYADDTVLLAGSKEDLQKCLDGLKQYCDKWKLEVNANKTKIIIFSQGRPLTSNHNFMLGDSIIEVVRDFRYLGVTFSYNGFFTRNEDEIVINSNRAIFGLIKKARKGNLPIDIQFDLFDKNILPILLYGCEIWGYKNLKRLEKLHLLFCKLVLKLKNSTPNIMVYGETGRFDLKYYAKKRIINFWRSIACGNKNKLSYIMYNLCKQRYEHDPQSSSEWFINLANMIHRYGIQGSIPSQEAIIKEVANRMHKNLKQEYINNWVDEINSSAKCSVLYKHIKPVFEREYYLSHIPPKLRLALSRVRTCNHKLPIEAGRYGLRYSAREERICTKCNSGSIGDEFHFILTCTNPELMELRERYISPYYFMYPNMEKLSELFNNRGLKLFKLARFVSEGLKLYC